MVYMFTQHVLSQTVHEPVKGALAYHLIDDHVTLNKLCTTPQRLSFLSCKMDGQVHLDSWVKLFPLSHVLPNHSG